MSFAQKNNFSHKGDFCLTPPRATHTEDNMTKQTIRRNEFDKAYYAEKKTTKKKTTETANENGKPSKTKQSSNTSDPVKMYLDEIGRIGLLSPEEERSLGEEIQEGVAAETELVEAEDVLTEEERAILERVKKTGRQARSKMVEANLRLVVSVAKRYTKNNIPLLDLIQEGNLGLMKAAERFDPAKGFRFSTYATWWIQQSISRALPDQAHTIRVPTYVSDMARKAFNVSQQLLKEYCREPTPEEIAQKTGFSAKQVKTALDAMRDPVSLEQPVGDDGGACLVDFYCDEEKSDLEETAIHSVLKEQLTSVLRTLPPREEKILRLRHGLEDNRPYTLDAIGKEFGLTKERIRQIESDALRKLRRPSRSEKLKDFWS